VKSAGWAGWLITEEGGGPKAGNTAALGPDQRGPERTESRRKQDDQEQRRETAAASCLSCD